MAYGLSDATRSDPETSPHVTTAPSTAPSPRITIVVPVYGDAPSLTACVESVFTHADEEWIDLLLVNDCGPEADALEELLLGMIADRPRARYARNPRNLGFVQTCNRAVSELDLTDNDVLLLNSDAVLTAGAVYEMRAVLTANERHGVVCARSNDATIATLPYYRSDRDAPTPERSAEVFEAISALLPPYYVAPVAVGFCMLIRRSLIENHGLFEEVYGAGYNEENDFCLRVNDIGYSALIANRALVFHVGSSSFGAERRAVLDAENGVTLEDRYPFYRESVVQFIRGGYATAERYADIIVPPAQRRRSVLIDLHHLSKIYDGTTKNVLSILDQIAALESDGELDIAIATFPDIAEFFHLERYGFRVLDYLEIEETFDLGVSPVPVTSFGQLVALNRYCARWAVSYLDAIALRTLRLATQTPMKPRIVLESLRWADRVLTISQASLDDIEALYPGALPDLDARSVILTQGSGLSIGTDVRRLAERSVISPVAAETISRGDYVFVVGNGFRHKQVRQTVDALEKAGIPFVAMGDLDLQRAHPDSAIVLSGTLTEGELEDVYAGASAVVYPSAYEGFGLPLAEAAQRGKRLVVFDTEVSREVTARLGIDEVTFFARFADLGDAVRAELTHSEPAPSPARSLLDYGSDFWHAARALLDEPLDVDRLDQRDAEISRLAGVAEGSLDTATRLLHQNAEILASRSFRLARRIADASSRMRSVLGREKAPTAPAPVDRAIINQS